MPELKLDNTNWYFCPGSIEKEKDYKPKEYDFENLTTLQKVLDDSGDVKVELNKRVVLALDYIKRRCDELRKIFQGSNVSIETDVAFDLSEQIADKNVNLTGEVHVALICKSDLGKVLHIEVMFYSDRNLYINVNHNPTLIGGLKALSLAYRINDVTSLRATVIQPSVDSDPIRHQNLTTWSLEAPIAKLFMAALKTGKSELPFVSGKHCHWCLHKPDCTQHIVVKKQEINKMDGGELSIIQSVHTSIKTMSLTQLANILDAEASFKDAFERARAEAKIRVAKGDIVSNENHQYVMGHGKKSKSWNEPEETIVKKLKGMKVIKDKYYPYKLITPAAALKLDGLTEKQLVNVKKLISEVDGKPGLIQTDKQSMSSEQAFADVAGGQTEIETPPKRMSFL